MSARHEELFEQYVADLRAVAPYVSRWWKDLIQAEERAVESHEEAVRRVSVRWPVGLGAHPRVIAIVRRYFLACVQLNLEIESKRRRPETGEAENVLPHRVCSDEQEENSDVEETDEEEESPAVLLGEWLLTPETVDLADMVCRLSYWPVGLDEQGNTI